MFLFISGARGLPAVSMSLMAVPLFSKPLFYLGNSQYDPSKAYQKFVIDPFGVIFTNP